MKTQLNSRTRFVSLLLVAVIFSNTAALALSGLARAQTTQCGTWEVRVVDAEKEDRVAVRLVNPGSGEDCMGEVIVENTTSVPWLGGGYHLQIYPFVDNAVNEFEKFGNGSDVVMLSPTLPMDLILMPLDPMSPGSVRLSGEWTFQSVVFDTGAYILKTGLDLLPGEKLGQCGLQALTSRETLIKELLWDSREAVASGIVRGSQVVADVVWMVAMGDYQGAKLAFSTVLPAFYQAVMEAVQETAGEAAKAGLVCLVSELLNLVSKNVMIAVKIFGNWMLSYGLSLYDEYRYYGNAVGVEIIYKPANPTATSRPTLSWTPTRTYTPQASVTPTWTPTDTPVPTPTNTPLPTATHTPIPLPTSTPIPIPTDTPIPPPTNTSVPRLLAGRTTNASIPLGGIQVVMLAPNGGGVYDCWGVNPNPVVAQTCSDVDGFFYIPDPPAGEYVIYPLIPDDSYADSCGYHVSVPVEGEMYVGDLSLSKWMTGEWPNDYTDDPVVTLSWDPVDYAVLYWVTLHLKSDIVTPNYVIPSGMLLLNTSTSDNYLNVELPYTGVDYEMGVHAYDAQNASELWDSLAHGNSWFFSGQENVCGRLFNGPPEPVMVLCGRNILTYLTSASDDGFPPDEFGAGEGYYNIYGAVLEISDIYDEMTFNTDYGVWVGGGGMLLSYDMIESTGSCWCQIP